MDKYSNLMRVEDIMTKIKEKIFHAEDILISFEKMWEEWEQEKQKVATEAAEMEEQGMAELSRKKTDKKSSATGKKGGKKLKKN